MREHLAFECIIKKYAEVQRPECGADDDRYGQNSAVLPHFLCLDPYFALMLLRLGVVVNANEDDASIVL